MREPAMIITDNGEEVERLPFSQCPSFMLEASATGRTKSVPSDYGTSDGTFNRQYAARLLRERANR